MVVKLVKGKYNLSEDVVIDAGLNLPQLLTVGEVSNILNVHVGTLREWTNNGVIRCYRIGPRRDRRFDIADIRRFLKKGGDKE